MVNSHGGHQQPPEVLQLWLAPKRRAAPKRAAPKRRVEGSRIDPTLVGGRLVRPPSAPRLEGKKRSKSPGRRQAPQARLLSQ